MQTVNVGDVITMKHSGEVGYVIKKTKEKIYIKWFPRGKVLDFDTIEFIKALNEEVWTKDNMVIIPCKK